MLQFQNSNLKKLKKIGGFKKILNSKWLPISLTVTLLVGVIFLLPVARQEILEEKTRFSTEYIRDPSVSIGEESVKQEGTEGTKTVTYRYKQSLLNYLLGRKNATKWRVSEEVVANPISRIITEGTKQAGDNYVVSSTNPDSPQGNSSPSPSVDCSAVYYENTKTYQEFWRQHLDSANSHIRNVDSQTHLTEKEKRDQANEWIKFFNERVDELLATWKRSMQDSGCGGERMRFSPGYMQLRN